MSKRLDKIKQYYSSMESLNPDIQEDMKWLISRVEELEEDNHDVRTSCKEWYDSYFRLWGETQRYKQALKELRSYAIESPVEREEDGSPLPDPVMDLVYHVTTDALKGESE